MPRHAKLLQPCLTLCYLRGAARLLHPWDFPGKNTGEGCLLQGISLPTQGSNLGLLHWQEDSLPPALNNFQQHLSNINIHMNQSGIFWKCRFTFHRPGVGFWDFYVSIKLPPEEESAASLAFNFSGRALLHGGGTGGSAFLVHVFNELTQEILF